MTMVSSRRGPLFTQNVHVCVTAKLSRHSPYSKASTNNIQITQLQVYQTAVLDLQSSQGEWQEITLHCLWNIS